jgi:hypothetical protein
MYLRKLMAVTAMVVMALVVTAAPAGADQVHFGEGPGQPVISGELHGEQQHGVIHCQPLANLVAPEAGPHSSPGVIVVTPAEKWILGAPAGGGCEEIYGFFKP